MLNNIYIFFKYFFSFDLFRTLAVLSVLGPRNFSVLHFVKEYFFNSL